MPPAFSFTSPLRSFNRFSNNINDYELHEVLGRGGFGVVVRAVSRCRGSDGMNVAIKMIDKSLMRAAGMTRRVASEVELHWQLHHPAVLELFNYFEDAIHVYLVMELCPNGELFSYIQQRRRPLSEPETRSVLKQLVNGLAYLHANHILHRDLKLSNLLLSRSFDLKIADFGLATRLADAAAEQKTMCGTPNYISPEIVSRRPYGLETDLWSLGCMMVTLLTGSPPFQSAAVKNTLDKVANLDYSLPDSLSSHAKDLIASLLQLDPKKRIPLANVLSHPFFNPSLPVSPLSPIQHTLPDKSPKLAHRPTPDTIPQPSSSNNNQKSKPSSATNSAGLTATQIHPAADTQAHRVHHAPTGDADASGRTLPPLSTAHLKPMHQQTKYGLVKILDNGDISLDFTGEPNTLTISGDGMFIWLRPRGTPLSSATQYTRSTLPTSLTKKYRYATRFVDLVRAKTPRIVFYSPQAKSMLMENGPTPDFEMVFYTGVRVYTSASRQMLEIRAPRQLWSQFPSIQTCPIVPSSSSGKPAGDSNEFRVYSINLGQHASRNTNNKTTVVNGAPSHTVHSSASIASISSSTSSSATHTSIPPDLQPLFKHAQECLRQCMDVDRSERFSTNTKFPIILKSSQTKMMSTSVLSTMSSRCESAPAMSVSATTRLSSRSTLAASVTSRHDVGGTVSSNKGVDRLTHTRDTMSSVSRNAGSEHGTTSGRVASTTVSGTTAVSGSASTGVAVACSVSRSASHGFPSSVSDSAALTQARNRHESGHHDHQGSGAVSSATSSCARIPSSSASASASAPQPSSTSTRHNKPVSTTSAASDTTTTQSPDIIDSPIAFSSTVGWCIRYPHRGFLVLFIDGARMVVHGSGTHLDFAASCSESFTTHAISTSLTPCLKTRLGQFTTLVKMLQQQQTPHHQHQHHRSGHHDVNKVGVSRTHT